MSVWEIILPHRLLVNRSLRKASEELRTHIEEYQLEYNREIERCTAEIEQAKADKDRDFEIVKASLINELSKDKSFFDTVQAGLFVYVDLYFQRQCLNKLREIKVLEKQTFIEYGNFLTEQMNLISEEIEILEARKDKLVLQAKVDDIIGLIILSGGDIAINSSDDVSALLVKVSELLDACDDNDKLKKYSLVRLRTVLQERVDFLPIIQYISWTIQQKKQIRWQLSSERRKTNDSKKVKSAEIQQVNDNLNTVNSSLDEQARIVREYWAIPITQLNIQISFLYRKLNRIFAEIKEAGESIQKMKNEGSDDSWTWERLWREKTDLKEQIPQVKSEIESLKSERQQWFERQQMLYGLCKRNNVYLISDNNSKESDECRIINNRLTELYRIEEEETKLAEECFLKESAQIQQRKKEKTTELSAQIANAEKSQAEKHAVFIQASKQLSSSISRDARFFLLKMFSDTEEVSRAKQALQVADSQKKKADIQLSVLKAELAKAITDFDNQLTACHPTPYRPSAAEIDERQKLEGRKTELMDKQSQKKSARKEGRYDGSN